MKIVRALVYIGLFLFTLNLIYIPKPRSEKIIAESYFGPKEYNRDADGLIRVEILVKDGAELSGLQIRSATFNHKEIPLKPRDIFGKRATASFQLPGGKYNLKWSANRNSLIWPRIINFEHEVILSPRDLWVQIQIEGDQVTIR